MYALKRPSRHRPKPAADDAWRRFLRYLFWSQLCRFSTEKIQPVSMKLGNPDRDTPSGHTARLHPDRSLILAEAVHPAVLRRDADPVADLVPRITGNPGRQHADIRHLDIKHGVGAEMLGM